MKVSLAVQFVASNSLSKALQRLHENGTEGFQDDDVLVTAKSLKVNDRLFDILNSRNMY